MKLKIAIAAVALSIPRVACATDPNAVTVTASLEAPRLVKGLPAILTLHFSSARKVDMDLGIDRTGAITILTQGPSVTRQAAYETHGLKIPGQFQIDPKFGYDDILVLPAEQFIQVGDYSLTINIADSGNPTFEYPNGKSISMEIIPYSDDDMRQACANLINKIEIAHSAGRRLELARALASTGNPIALPYLESGIGRVWGVDSELIAGIEKIGTVESVNALKDALGSSQQELATRAKGALLRMANNVDDEDVRLAARRALRDASK